MTDLYLVLHKSRGQPRFDIAVRDKDFPDRWTRPADDARVFPYAMWRLCDLTVATGFGCHNNSIFEGMSLQPPNDDWPDSYHRETWPDYNPRSVSNPKIVEAGKSLLSALGLTKPIQSKLKRRV